MTFHLMVPDFDLHEAPVKRTPKLKLSDDVPVSEKFRREFDAGLLEHFGEREECHIPQGDVVTALREHDHWASKRY